MRTMTTMRTMRTILLVFAALALAGCSTNNRNIVFIESSGIAIIVSYNPQTELPEGKVGYFRGMFCIVPTGLNTDPGGTGGKASDVPTVIVKQKVVGGLMSGIDIDNRFLIGMPDTSPVMSVGKDGCNLFSTP